MPRAGVVSSLLHSFRTGGVRVTVIISRFKNASNVIAVRSVVRRVMKRVGSRCSSRRHACIGLGSHACVFRTGALLSSFCGVVGTSPTLFRGIRKSTSALTNLLLRVGKRFPMLRRQLSCKGCRFRMLRVGAHHVLGMGIVISSSDSIRRRGG